MARRQSYKAIRGDGLADTVKPQLEQAKADGGKISVIDEKIKSLSMIDERLGQAVINKAQSC